MAYADALAGPEGLRHRARPGVKWVILSGLLAIAISASIGAALVGRRVQPVHGTGYGLIFLVALFVVLGSVLAIRRPRNPIGWLFLSTGVCFVLSALATSYSILDYVHDHGSLPFGWLFLLFAEFWAPAIVLLSVAALLFPDGRPSSPTIRLLLVVLLLAALVWQGGAFGIAVSAIANHTIHIDTSGDLYAIDHAVGAWSWWYAAAQPVFFITLALVWLAWLVQQVPAYRRSSGDRRLQLKWLYGGVTVCGIGGMLIAAFTSATSEPFHAFGLLGNVLLCALPVSVGIALLKFHLYDIDKVVSRTVSYTLLTGVLAGLYVGVVAFVTRVLPLSSSVAVAISTLVAAAAFNPLRKRLQHMVDRRFNRAHYDAQATVAAFAERLRTVIELGRVEDDLLTAVNGALEPSSVGIWLAKSGYIEPAQALE